MFAFELAKQGVSPHIAIWTSRTVTILFTSLVATVAAYIMGKKLASANSELEARICERTSDITEANQKLTFERSVLRTVTDNIPDSIFAKDAAGRFLLVNNAFAKHHGVESSAELLGKTAFDLFPHDQAAEAQVDDLQVMRVGGAIMERERFTVDDRGDVKWALTTKVPLIDQTGGVVGIVGVYRDITRFKQAEQKLRQSEANLAAAQRIAHFGSFEQDITDLDHLEHGPVRCSEEVFRILGHEPGSGDPSRTDFFRMVHPDDRDRIREVVAGTIRGSKPYRVDYRIVRPDQTERIVQGTGDVVCDAQTHKPLKLVGTMQDITDRKRTEAQVEEANQRLAERVQELQRRSQEISVLSEMGGWLQSCQTADEAYAIIGKSAERLFQEWSGALYVISPSRIAVETVTDWGRPICGERVFAPDDCWALRRGRPHWFEVGGTAASCHHTDPAQVADSLCVPLMAQGEGIGILNLQRSHSQGRRATGNGVQTFVRSRAEVGRRAGRTDRPGARESQVARDAPKPVYSRPTDGSVQSALYGRIPGTGDQPGKPQQELCRDHHDGP
jgi:PAS domain S-box-containing protein